MTEISPKFISPKSFTEALRVFRCTDAEPIHSFLVPIKRSLLLAAIWPVNKLNAGAFVSFRCCFSFRILPSDETRPN